jgi:hypothetical protein
MNHPRRLAGRWLVRIAAAALLVAGCGGGGGDPPDGPEVPVPPTPDSPANAVRLLEWCWEQRDEVTYRDVFTNDFRYVFSPADSQAVGAGLDRDGELHVASNLFETGAVGRPAATRIVFDLNSTLQAFPDTRPGKHPTWHKEIRSNGVRVIVITPAQTYSVVAPTTFYVVRGDSALIPPDLIARGFTPDPNRWYVERWEDQTVCSSPDKPCPTLGDVKRDYSGTPAGAVRRPSSR